MAYHIYGDGEIWKDGKKYATIYPDGEIWRDGRPYARVYGDGEIWKDGKEIGKVYDDGEVWINNVAWGKIYSTDVSTPAPTPMQNDYSETDNSAYSVPDIPDVGGGGLDLEAFGIFAAGFFILFLISCVVGVFVTGIDMWREFTVGRIEEFGDAGAIAAGILIVGVIFGFVTQYSKFNGGFIAGLVMQSVIICVASLLGAVVVAGIESFTLEDMDPIVFFGMFVYMALFPSLLCKLLAVVANKLGIKSNNSKPKKTDLSNSQQSKATAVNNAQATRAAAPAPQAVHTQRPAVNDPQTTRNTTPATQTANTQRTKPIASRKNNKTRDAFDELFDFIDEQPLIVRVLAYGLILCAIGWLFYTFFTSWREIID